MDLLAVSTRTVGTTTTIARESPWRETLNYIVDNALVDNLFISIACATSQHLIKFTWREESTITKLTS
jgi:hypothetical protein